MLFSELKTICNGEVLQQAADETLSGLCIDTRNVIIQKGLVFFAIQGSNHDGHQYVEEAHNQGIRLFVVEKDVVDLDGANVLKVASSIEAMQCIASYHRSLFDYPVLGITGSNGKTIVKEWLATLLSQSHQVVKSPKSYNSQVGVPLSVWQMSENDNLGIFEAGISKAGEMANLEKIIKPTIGIFTNLGEAHNEGFTSKIEKAEEKALLFKGCQKVIYSKSEKIIEDALLKYVDDKSKLMGWIAEQLNQHMIRITFSEHTINLRLKFKEPYFIENAIHCAVVMKELGLDENVIQSGLNNLSAVKMRLELKQAIGQSYLIDDTYNNDLHGMEVALDFLSRQNQKRTKSVIFSDISQTGIEGASLYSKVNQLFRKNQVAKVIGIGKEVEKYKAEIDIPAEYFTDTDSFLKSNHKLTDEVVLVKGARNFAFERIVSQLEKNIHRTVLEINLENVVHNLNYYRSKLQPRTKIMTMVKAYAYGGGIFEIANLLQYHKVDYLGVAYIDEAVELRKHGIYVPIMIMNPTSDSFRLLKEYNLEPEIYSLDLLHEFISYFEDTDGIPSIHLKLESGMNRLGFTADELTKVQHLIARTRKLKVRSVFSHLAGSESPLHDSYSESQVKKFTQMADEVCEPLWYKPLRHIANTGGISRFPQYHFDMVRLGVGLYGYDPTEQEQHQLKAVGTLKSNISQIKKIKKGETVGYGRKGLANKDMSIATIPIGYADGYLRAFGNGKGAMLVRDQLVSVFGNVCMDMTMLDVTNVDCKIGDEVIVFGERPSVKELSDQIGTIPYEIMTNIGQRVKRVFQSE